MSLNILKDVYPYLISVIRNKVRHGEAKGFRVKLVWIPSHVDIAGTERAKHLAKLASLNGRLTLFT